jgi:ribonuclease HIII
MIQIHIKVWVAPAFYNILQNENRKQKQNKTLAHLDLLKGLKCHTQGNQCKHDFFSADSYTSHV